MDLDDSIMASSNRRIAVAALAAALIVTLRFPWVSLRVRSEHHALLGREFSAGRWVVIAWSIAMVVAALTSRREPTKARWVLLAGFSSMLVGGAALLLAIEISGSLIPASIVPRTVRRELIGASSGPGLWLLLAIGAVGLAACVLPERESSLRRDAGALVAHQDWLRLGALATAALAVLLLAIARYQPWFTASLGPEELRPEGWQLPWFGPLSFLAVGAAAAALACVAVSPRLDGLCLLAIFAAGCLNVVAALLIVVPGAVGRVAVGGLLEHRLHRSLPGFDPSEQDLMVGVGRGAAMAYLSSVLLAISCSFLLAREPAASGDRR